MDLPKLTRVRFTSIFLMPLGFCEANSSDLEVALRPPRYKVLSFAGGDPVWSRSASRLYREASRSASVASIKIYGPEAMLSLPSAQKRGVKAFLEENKRGFGYWSWKPLIVSHELMTLPSHLDGIIWLDVGCTLNFSNRESCARWASYQDESEAFSFKFFRLNGPNTHSEWTKKQALDHYQLPDAINRNLFTASAFLVSKSNDGIELVHRWMEACFLDNGRLLVDSALGEIESKHFREHRHDQSLISLELEKLGYLGAADETYFPNGWNSLGVNYPIWTSRLRSGFENPSESFLMKVVRRTEREIVNRFGEFNEQNWHFDSNES